MSNVDVYNSIFTERYCRRSELLKLFSERNKAETWRQLWIWLAEAEKELGLSQITEEMIDELRQNKTNIDFALVRETEKRLKHDVMSHIEVYGKVCPKAAGIIHLGATSCFVQDNADLIIQRKALSHIMKRVEICLRSLKDFGDKNADVPTVGRTHYQVASLITVGKRASLWAQELLHALKKLRNAYEEMCFRGIKGATGTQDSFLTLFHGDEKAVVRLDDLVTKKAGFSAHFDVTGQTYPRFQDSDLLFALSTLGAATNRIALDIRLLQSVDEVREPFESEQVGSSAMPYKRNPMKCERICGLARYLKSAILNGLDTASVQGFERTLDDSSNRRIVIPDAFLAADTILSTLQAVLRGLNVNYGQIKKNVDTELPFVALEKALMLLTQCGVPRDEAHGKIKEISLKAYNKSKETGETVKFEEMLSDGVFDKIRDKMLNLYKNPLNFCGRCVSQVREFSEQLGKYIDDEAFSKLTAGAKVDEAEKLEI